MSPELWRRIAGIAILVLLVVVTAALMPPYFENFKFQQYLDGLVDRQPNPELLRAAVVDKAAQMGLPVRSGDVHVARSGNAVKVDIVYVVRVDFPLYTVDLHFHPGASSE